MVKKTITVQSGYKKQKGFTLIEVLVSLSIFTVVVTMSVGTMVVLIDANSKAQFMQSIVINTSFALDSMTRDIRTGSNYVCLIGIAPTNAADPAWDSKLIMSNNNATPNDCDPGKVGFAFTESGGSLTSGASNNRVAFRLNSSGSVSSIERKVGGKGVWQAVTADNVNITTLEFTVRHTDVTDNRSPLVTIFIAGEGVGDYQNTDFSLRTTITQRALDI